MTDLFRTVARALQPHVTNTYDLLAAADAVVNVLPPEPVAYADSFTTLDIPHEVLVRVGHNSPEVMAAIREGKRINAIKALREVFRPNDNSRTLVGLRAAKMAMEDSSFAPYFNLNNLVPQGDPWGFADRNEPSF